MGRIVRSMVVVVMFGVIVSQAAAGIAYMESAPFSKKSKTPGIVISGKTVTSKDIAAAIRDKSKFRKKGNTVTLLTNLLVKWDGGGLKIENEKWVFGKGCLMEVQGTLIVDKSEITSSAHKKQADRGKIIARSHRDGPSRRKPGFGWTFKILRSKISYMAWVGQAYASASGGPRGIPVFAGNDVSHCAYTPNLGGYIVDNRFHDVGQISGKPVSDANCLINLKVTKKWGSVKQGVGLFDGNVIEDCTVNYLAICWGFGATVSNNIYRNLGYVRGGRHYRTKAGSKGALVRNNLFDNTAWKGKTNIVIAQHVTQGRQWGEISGNIVHGFKSAAVEISRNGPGKLIGTKCRVLGNFLISNSNGILMKFGQYHGPGWPIDVVIKDNTILGCANGIGGKAVKLVRSGNFVDGKFVEEAPKELDKEFVRVTLAPTAVWHGGRIQTITMAVAALKPVKSVKVAITTTGGKKKNVLLTPIKATAYPYDYIGKFSTKGFKVGKGTVTVSAQDTNGKESKATATYEVRVLAAVPYLSGKDRKASGKE